MTAWLEKSPPEWQTYVNREVKVTADENNKYQGWVVTIDPVSASMVLADFQENEKREIRVVMGHAVQNVEVLRGPDEIISEKLSHVFGGHETSAQLSDDLEARKQSLKSWLEQNNIPVALQGESSRTLCVAGVLTIDPPYGVDNCSSTNEIILSRVQGLLQGYLAKQ
ncbi:gem-associated protein 6 [Hyperolius riggenbachi]|uniref:gem-associated protein 6 n=1 Tax=Hyperolius riggenbachi TaxID=752182 RepID=UPI0035A2A6E7